MALLERLATDRPVVVAFEDLHWADPSTLRAIRAIGRALPELPVVLLVTLRPFPERSELAQVIDELVRHGAAALALEALDDPTVIALAEAVAGAPPGMVLSGQLSWAAGNPLFVIELIKALREQGSLALRQGRADVADLSLPQTLPLTILRRVSNLAPQTLEVLRVAAVLGREFSVAELSMVTGRSAVALRPELDGALRAGLLAESAMGLVFRHELIREVIYHDVPPVLRQAALEAAPRSLAVAVKLCERAFHLTSADDPDREVVAAELAPLLLQAGRPRTPSRSLGRSWPAVPGQHTRSSCDGRWGRSCGRSVGSNQPSPNSKPLPASPVRRTATGPARWPWPPTSGYSSATRKERGTRRNGPGRWDPTTTSPAASPLKPWAWRHTRGAS